MVGKFSFEALAKWSSWNSFQFQKPPDSSTLFMSASDEAGQGERISRLWPGMCARRHNRFLASGRRPMRQYQIKSK